MARVFKEEEFNAKRNEILDVAMSLVYTRGYEQMTIQDILDRLQISRGALYHYFDSKHAILEALIGRSASGEMIPLLQIVQDPNLSAVQKIQAYFDTSTRWKTMQKELVLSTLQNWYSDDNALIRQKLTSESLKYMSHFLEPIIRQGIEEKAFNTPYPEEVALIFAGITLSLSDRLVDLMLNLSPDQEPFQKAQAYMDAYFDSVERMLGAPAGSFKVLDVGVFKAFFAVSQPEQVLNQEIARSENQ